MGLEDISMFRTLLGSTVLYPCDAVSTERLVEQMLQHDGLVYVRTTRKDTPVLYSAQDEFKIGGSRVLQESAQDQVTVVGAGITVHEALAAHTQLQAEGTHIRVIDLYSIKPIDVETLSRAAAETKSIITVEDHFAEGGLGEAVRTALAASATPVISLAVRKLPRSGKPDELLAYEDINSVAIQTTVKQVIKKMA